MAILCMHYRLKQKARPNGMKATKWIRVRIVKVASANEPQQTKLYSPLLSG